MSEINLQKNNRKAKKIKQGFFDVEPIEIRESAPDPQTETVAVDLLEHKEKNKRFALILALSLTLLALLLVGAGILSRLDIFDGSIYDNDLFKNEEESGDIQRFDIYKPDWEIDIFKVSEYVELSPERITYSDDGGTTTSKLYPADFYRTGGDKLLFMSKYFDAVKNGDHEALNTMHTDRYFENNPRFTEMPMQRVYDIRITRILHSEREYDDTEYMDYYFEVRYNIQRNDGYFNREVDEMMHAIKIYVVLVDTEGNAKIDKIIDA